MHELPYDGGIPGALGHQPVLHSESTPGRIERLDALVPECEMWRTLRRQGEVVNFSLQLAISLQNFDEGYTNLGGIYAPPAKPLLKALGPQATPATPKIDAMAPSKAARAAKEPPPPEDGQIIHPIVRDVPQIEPEK